MVALLLYLPEDWARAREYLRSDLEHLQTAINTRWAQTFSDSNTLQAFAISGDSTIATQYVANTGTNNAPEWNYVNLSNGVTNRLPFNHLVAATAPSVLLGREEGTTGNFEQISLGASLKMDTTILRSSFVMSAMFGVAVTGFDPADSTTYYFGLQPGINPTTTADSGYRLIAPVTGVVSKVYGQLVVTTPGTTESATLVVRNITANTVQNISTAVATSAATNTFSNEAMTLAVTKGDALVIKLTTPAYATNPLGVFGYVSVVIV